MNKYIKRAIGILIALLIVGLFGFYVYKSNSFDWNDDTLLVILLVILTMAVFSVNTMARFTLPILMTVTDYML